MRGLIRRLRSIAVDVSPLRESRDFRLLWLGQSISFLGTQMSIVALPFQVFSLTRSSFAVGLLGLAELGPMLVLTMLGGALADTRDRRGMLVRADIAAIVIASLLALNASLAHPKLWAIYVLAGAAGGIEGMRAPSGWSILPRLVPADQIPAASALNAMYYSAGTLVGPAIAGALIASVGLPSTFVIDAVTFLASLAALAAMRPVPPAEDAEKASLASIFEGLRFLRGKQALQGTYLVDYVAMIFGMPRALFPALVLNTFHRGPRVLGLFYAAPAVGSLVASAVSGWSSRVRRQGRVITIAVIVWGVAIAVLGVSPWIWLALAAVAVAGAADMVSGIFRMTMWARLIPDNVRGRVSGIGWINVASGPILGDFEAGALAALTSVRFSIVSGGVACVAGALILVALLPQFLRYDARGPGGVSERSERQPPGGGGPGGVSERSERQPPGGGEAG